MNHLNLWIESKKVAAHQLPFLKLVKEPSQLIYINTVCEKLIMMKASHSDGLKILELASELILMGKTEAITADAHNLNDWYKSLKRARYPMTSAIDETKEAFFLQQPWPYNSKIKFERRGDRSGVEFRCFISDETDLTKIISSLERIKDNLKKA